VVVFITNALLRATFKRMSSQEFKERYLYPLNLSILESNITGPILKPFFRYPPVEGTITESYIQEYFDSEIAPSIRAMYEYLCGNLSTFGRGSFRPPLTQGRLVAPGLAHIRNGKKTSFLCFAIGTYKKYNYTMDIGLALFVLSLETFRIRPVLYEGSYFYERGEWSKEREFSLILRKYFHQALLCGTNRIFISDHQKFSGFFEYNFDASGKMEVEYFVINNPETIEGDITLRSAMMGFFYNTDKSAERIMETLRLKLEQAKLSTEIKDPLGNIGRNKSNKAKETSELLIEDKEPLDLYGNSYCRVEYDASKNLPNLNLPCSTVFVKMYYYDEDNWIQRRTDFTIDEDIPSLNMYYDMYYTECDINSIIAQTQFDCNFPELLASGHRNGSYDQETLIFEYLGEQLPVYQWDKRKVRQVIRSRLKELHSLGISHNDIRIPKIYVSVSGKIWLIDFGLSDSSNNKSHMSKDFEYLDEILGIYGDNDADDDDNETNAIPYRSGTPPADTMEESSVYSASSDTFEGTPCLSSHKQQHWLEVTIQLRKKINSYIVK
ncbi:uncharacterized protein RJT20DRAFT_99359, partial [Scheffersomyces xylosifermentans]|uniref:uncharacterized protein n=1 Tax=Scheffersomyces xylosifermentans TaxID=1304137 RepID=UPI00315DD3FA